MKNYTKTIDKPCQKWYYDYTKSKEPHFWVKVKEF